MNARSARITAEQLNLAQWLVANATSPFHTGSLPHASIPAEVKGSQEMEAADYNLAAYIATTASPTHYVMYLPEYGQFFFQPRLATSFPVIKVKD